MSISVIDKPWENTGAEVIQNDNGDNGVKQVSK